MALDVAFDLEQALCDWLIAILDAGPTALHRRVVTEPPDDLLAAAALPCHIVTRIGGPTIVVGLSEPRLDISTYATGTDPHTARAAALARANDVHRAIVLYLPNQHIGGVDGAGGGFINRVWVDTEPVIRPYDSRNQIRKAQAVYRFRVHRPL